MYASHVLCSALLLRSSLPRKEDALHLELKQKLGDRIAQPLTARHLENVQINEGQSKIRGQSDPASVGEAC